MSEFNFVSVLQIVICLIAVVMGQVIGHKNFGTGFSLATFIWSVISALPPTIAGLVYDAFGSYDWHFSALAALTLLSGVGAWLAKPPSEVEYTRQSGEQSC